MNSTQAKTSTSKNLLPFPVIVSAAGGDADAINYVLKYYAGYIAVLSMRTLYDENGNPHLCIGENKLRKLAEENLNVGWVIMNGNRIQIKRKKFEKILDTLEII